MAASTGHITIRPYKDESDLPTIVSMISADLSEPYSIYVYRYFIHQWPELCFVVCTSVVQSLHSCKGMQRS